MAHRRFEEAVELLREVVREHPDSAAAYQMLGKSYLHLQQPAAATSALQEAVRLAPQGIEGHFLLGAARFMQKDYRGAAEAWRKGVETNRFSIWGERCGDALKQVEAGESVQFA